jgi:hypothetical protein
MQYKNMTNLAFENPSWQVIDALPKWTRSLSNTLREHLIFVSLFATQEGPFFPK